MIADLQYLVAGGDGDREDLGVQAADGEAGQRRAGNALPHRQIGLGVEAVHQLREVLAERGAQSAGMVVGLGDVGDRLVANCVHRPVEPDDQQRSGNHDPDDEPGPGGVVGMRGAHDARRVCDPQADAGGEGDAQDCADGEGVCGLAGHLLVAGQDEAEHQGLRAEQNGQREGGEHDEVRAHRCDLLPMDSYQRCRPSRRRPAMTPRLPRQRYPAGYIFTATTKQSGK